MKKLCFITTIFLLLLLTVSANARYTLETKDSVDVCPMTTAEFEEYIESIPWNALNDVWAKQYQDPYHNTFSFYSSKGCSDISCADLTHSHWCPSGICNDSSHGHSAGEYAEAARSNPHCPCHRR